MFEQDLGVSGIVESYPHPQGGQVGCETHLKQTWTKWHLKEI